MFLLDYSLRSLSKTEESRVTHIDCWSGYTVPSFRFRLAIVLLAKSVKRILYGGYYLQLKKPPFVSVTLESYTRCRRYRMCVRGVKRFYFSSPVRLLISEKGRTASTGRWKTGSHRHRPSSSTRAISDGSNFPFPGIQLRLIIYDSQNKAKDK